MEILTCPKILFVFSCIMNCMGQPTFVTKDTQQCSDSNIVVMEEKLNVLRNQFQEANSLIHERISNLEAQVAQHAQVIDASYKDCASYRNVGVTTSGVYPVNTHARRFSVYCDMHTSGGGWLVFQRRQDGSGDFYRNWTDYQQGFGNLTSEFWLGNDNIASVTDQGTYELRVDLEDFDGDKRFAVYTEFSIDKSDKYRLKLGKYSGDAGNSLSSNSGYRWTTLDQDNDGWTDNCASRYKGAWWYTNVCGYSNLNGLYLRGPNTASGEGVNWAAFRGFKYSLKFSEMKLRPAGYTPF